MRQYLEFITLIIACTLVALAMKQYIKDCPSDIMTTLVASVALLKSCKEEKINEN
jgi:hypothetical protein